MREVLLAGAWAWGAAAAGCAAAPPPRDVWVVDRTEGGAPVVFDGRGVRVARAQLEGLRLREGDVLVERRLDPAEKQRRLEEVAALRRRLSGGDDGSDLSLADSRP